LVQEKVPDSEIVAPLVVSVRTMVYVTLTNVAVSGEQLNPSSAAVVGDSVRLPTRFPFWSTGKFPVAETGVWVVVLFEADGFFDPPFTHSTGRSSSLQRSRTGAGSPGQARCSSSRARLAEPLRGVLQRRVRDELLNTSEFYTRHEAMLVADFQMDYNWLRPHSSLGDLAPAVFAERWRTGHQPARLS
jgi:hypothetical protein